MAKNPHFFSQLAYIELLSTNLDETVRFYTDIVGMDQTGKDDNSVYLRAWGDYFFHTLKITQSDTKGLGAVGWRADSQDALDECVNYLDKVGAGKGWIEADLGRGKAFKFQSPDGHKHEVFWDVNWLRETGEKASIYADRYSSNRRIGANVRRIDHFTYLVAKNQYAKEKEFWQGMGLKNPDEIRIEDHIPPIGGLWTTANLSHDIAVFSDPNLEPGQGIANHICYNLDSREEVLLALDYFTEKGYKSVWGAPTRHKADEGFFFYIMEPHTGILLEVYACARLIFAPDHGPDVHYLRDNPNDAWGNTNPFEEMAKGKIGGLETKPVDL
ncbi:VOC family protein [Flavobacterium sp. WC2409]|uniref:VOC family protein n=1 Tax=Flavobacterium sp. WC2409 TaxID=3234139 RepID=A0AB39W519_9FLAO